MGTDKGMLKIKDYKCFYNNPEGFESIKDFNLIVGKNNTGKSSLIDLVSFAMDTARIPRSTPGRESTLLVIEDAIDREVLRYHLGNTSNNYNNWDGQKLLFGVGRTGNKIYLDTYPAKKTTLYDVNRVIEMRKHGSEIPLKGKLFRRIYADRDIEKEQESDEMHLEYNGRGATNIICSYLTKAKYDSGLIEDVLLNNLNSIYKPDSCYTRIQVQQWDDDYWEIFLEEEGKGIIPLSKSGSGLRTVILVLLNTEIIPVLENRPKADFVFGFEELENNLHPSLFRRLLRYLFDYAKKEGSPVFVTTHSAVAIDMLSNKPEAQILHVRKSGYGSKVQTVSTYIDSVNILDDLDIRASDLLQSNVLVWLEGPSDRIYFNRWIELYSNGAVREYEHYQCVTYGGKLLSHFTAESDVRIDDLINILTINRNAIVIMDSDLKKNGDLPNATKRRISNELNEGNGYAWITKGREIENYIPVEALREYYSKNTIEQIGLLDEFGEYLDKLKAEEGTVYRRKKADYAANIAPFILKDHLEALHDLKDRVSEIVEKILAWNRT